MDNKYDTTTTSLFEMEVDETDFQTGEVRKTTKAKVVKRPKTPEFLMLFTAGAPLLRDANLTNSAELVLSKILEKWVLQKNRVELGTIFINHLIQELGTSRSTIYTALSLLKKRKVLVQDKEGSTGAEIKNAWYLNPYIFGKGKWNDIQKLRFDLSVEFDFVSLEASSKATRIAEYSDDDKLFDPHNYNVIGHTLDQNLLDNSQELEIIVEDKLINEPLPSLSPTLQSPSVQNDNQEISLSLLQEKNKEKELQIQLKKLSLDELKMKIEAQKLGIDL